MINRLKSAFCAVLVVLAPEWCPAAGLAWERSRAEVSAQPGQAEVNVEFPFKNTSSTPVRIVAIVSGCACTSGTADKATYQPGESGKVTAKFAVGDLRGRQEKVLSVETDGDGSKTERLQLIVAIREFVALSSQWSVWQVGQEPSAKTIECAALNDLSVEVTGVSPADRSIATRIETCERGKRYRVHLQPVSTDKPLTVAVEIQFSVSGFGAAVKTVHAVVRR